MPKQSTPKPTASHAYSEHAEAIYLMAQRIGDAEWGVDALQANWGHVGDLGHARKLLAEALFALGAMDADAASEHGANL